MWCQEELGDEETGGQTLENLVTSGQAVRHFPKGHGKPPKRFHWKKIDLRFKDPFWVAVGSERQQGPLSWEETEGAHSGLKGGGVEEEDESGVTPKFRA